MADQDSRSAETVARILGAARNLFLAKNYADVTTDMIARAAEVTKGGLYHHFSSKEALYVSMMLSELERKRDLFGRAVAMPGTCRERLARLTADFLNLPAEERDIIRLVRRDVNVFSGWTRERMVKAYQRALPEQVETILRDGIRDGEVVAADARLLSWSFVALVEVMMNDYADLTLGSTEGRLEQALGIFFDGVATSQIEVLA